MHGRTCENPPNKKPRIAPGFQSLIRCCRTVPDLNLVGVAGFEPTTTSPPDWCATRLRYTPESRSAEAGAKYSATGTGRGDSARHQRYARMQPERRADCESAVVGKHVAASRMQPLRPFEHAQLVERGDDRIGVAAYAEPTIGSEIARRRERPPRARGSRPRSTATPPFGTRTAVPHLPCSSFSRRQARDTRAPRGGRAPPRSKSDCPRSRRAPARRAPRSSRSPAPHRPRRVATPSPCPEKDRTR